MNPPEDTWADEEARSITSCCHSYMDEAEGHLVCRSCKRPLDQFGRTIPSEIPPPAK